MPEGIVPELLAAAALLAIIAGAFFLSRREQPPSAPEERPDEPAASIDVLERPAEVAPPVAEEPASVMEPIVIPEPKEVDEAPVATAPPPEEIVLERPSLRDRLTKTRRFFTERLTAAFTGGLDDETWDDVEAALIQADIGVNVATRITEDLRTRVRSENVSTPEGVRALLAEELVSLFSLDRDRALMFAPEGLTVWLVVGVNGTGKTTTIGKLARTVADSGRTVALAAADTFRAAADEQLDVWAKRSGAQIVKHQPGADPGAVAFDAQAFARARGIDVLLVDTAGRLHTKTPLMDELAKIRRVIEKESQVAETLLVIDATAGQNGLVQAKEFAQATGVSGIVLTKLDGTAKGGIALAIEDALGIPIKLIGVGEGVDDIEPFDPKAFVDALLS